MTKGRPRGACSLSAQLCTIPVGGSLIFSDRKVNGLTATHMERSVTSAVSKDTLLRERKFRTERLLGVKPTVGKCEFLLRVWREV